jgi:histidinol-phosphatase (PHP family)
LRSLDWNDAMEPGFRKLCRYCAKHNVLLEYNVLGMQANRRTGRQGYPNDHFWKIAKEEGCTAIIGMDAHHPKDLREGLYWQARRTLNKWKIPIADSIETTDFKALKAQKEFPLDCD